MAEGYEEKRKGWISRNGNQICQVRYVLDAEHLSAHVPQCDPSSEQEANYLSHLPVFFATWLLVLDRSFELWIFSVYLLLSLCVKLKHLGGRRFPRAHDFSLELICLIYYPSEWASQKLFLRLSALRWSSVSVAPGSLISGAVISQSGPPCCITLPTLPAIPQILSVLTVKCSCYGNHFMACKACENARMKTVYEVVNCPTVRKQARRSVCHSKGIRLLTI